MWWMMQISLHPNKHTIDRFKYNRKRYYCLYSMHSYTQKSLFFCIQKGSYASTFHFASVAILEATCRVWIRWNAQLVSFCWCQVYPIWGKMVTHFCRSYVSNGLNPPCHVEISKTEPLAEAMLVYSSPVWEAQLLGEKTYKKQHCFRGLEWRKIRLSRTAVRRCRRSMMM